MSTPSRTNPLRRPLWLGTVASILLMVSSWSSGAQRTRGGIVRMLNLDWIMYGHVKNIGFILSWVALGLLLYCWCLWGRIVYHDNTPIRESVKTLVGWIVPLIFASPMYSRDVYSYLVQGAMVRDGFDPYKDGAAVNPGPMLLEVSPDWRNTTTPYGPLHLWIGDGITTLVGSNITIGVFLYKFISVAGYAAIAWAVISIARHIGGNPAVALWLGVANPVVFLHLVGGMHNESVMVAFSCLGLVLALRRHPLWGALFIGIGFSLKATALVTLPFLIWIAMRQRGIAPSTWSLHDPRRTLASLKKAIPAFVFYGITTVLIVCTVLTAITYASGSSWGWVSQLSGNTKVINLLALPSFLAQFTAAFAASFFPGATFNSVLSIYRSISMIIMVVLLVVVWWRFRQTPRRAIEGAAWAYLITCIFNAVTLPWYYAAGVVLVGTFRPSPRVTHFTVIASLIVAGSFTGSGNNWLYRWSWMWIVITVAFVLYFAVFRGDESKSHRLGTAHDLAS
ncbi:alpha-(1-_6)-mannopyranosyltransferase A [Corynebacterium sp.]|uniref:alpha-(1->6)-mannopyranosyltransferase A n=1 Tax=Corynebacterium sp. TaxID=1720 RepID=UPI0026DB4FD1|nr:alpha-(1->6)-mannopyranosyltransferase A [Corynebacterium sp.]MDO4914007.1 alpha-(1->6)-mannopyranosyltransferase A [Corynebacterium sp.]